MTMRRPMQPEVRSQVILPRRVTQPLRQRRLPMTMRRPMQPEIASLPAITDRLVVQMSPTFDRTARPATDRLRLMRVIRIRRPRLIDRITAPGTQRPFMQLERDRERTVTFRPHRLLHPPHPTRRHMAAPVVAHLLAPHVRLAVEHTPAGPPAAGRPGFV